MRKPTYLFSTSTHPDTISINSLKIELLKPTVDFSQYDYFILTSKQAIEALKQYETDAFINIKALCISNQTAKSYEAIGGEVLELGSGYGDTLTNTIKKYPKSTKWLYMRARVVASNFVQECITEGYAIDETIFYESKCSQDILDVKVESGATLIFTSPSSVECYLKNHIFTSEDNIIVIGKTTAQKIPQNISYQIANEPTIEACLEF